MQKLRNWFCGKESTVKFGTEKAGGEGRGGEGSRAGAMKNLFAVLQLKPAPCGFRGGDAFPFLHLSLRVSLYILQRSSSSSSKSPTPFLLV